VVMESPSGNGIELVDDKDGMARLTAPCRAD
jgi:hypothetical protein